MTKSLHITKKIKFHGVVAPNLSATTDIKEKKNRIKQNSSNSQAVDGGDSIRDASKKLMGPEKKLHASKAKTYKASEVLLDMYKKISLNQFTGCSGFRAPGRTGVVIPPVKLSVESMRSVGLPLYIDDVPEGSAAISPDGRFVLMGTCEANNMKSGRILCLRLDKNGLQLAESLKIGATYSSLTFTPDGEYAIIGSRDSHVYCLQLSDAGEITIAGKFQAHGWVDSSPVITPDGKHVLVGAEQGFYCLNLAADGSLTKVGEIDIGCHNSSAISSNGKFAIITGDKLRCYLIEKTGKLRLTDSYVSIAPLIESSPAISPDGKYIVYGDNAGYLHCLELTTSGKLIPRNSFKTTSPVRSSPAFSPDGKFVVFASSEAGAIYCLEIGEFGLLTLKSSLPHNTVRASPTFSPDGSYVLMGSSDDYICCYHVSEEGILTEAARFLTKGSVETCPIFTLDGRHIVVGSWQGWMYYLNLT